MLDSTAGWAANAALTGITLIPLGTFWVLDLQKRVQHQSQPSRLAQGFLRAALPVLMVGVILAMVAPAVMAAMEGSRRSSLRAYRAARYTAVTSAFVMYTASILTTLAVYLSGIGALYVAIAKPKWWKLVRVDALCGSVLFFVVVIAWWARNLVVLGDDSDGSTFLWLLIIVDIALSFLAAGVAGLTIYAMPKLKERSHLGVGNLSALLLSASILWLFRCVFVLSLNIKTTLDDWTSDELDAQKIMNPILDLWVSAAVLGLVTFIMRLPVWSDPAAIPNSPPAQQIVYVQPVYVQHPQYGFQQPVYQQYQQQPVSNAQPVPFAQQPPMAMSQTPVPATRMYEDAAQGAQGVDLHAAGHSK